MPKSKHHPKRFSKLFASYSSPNTHANTQPSSHSHITVAETASAPEAPSPSLPILTGGLSKAPLKPLALSGTGADKNIEGKGKGKGNKAEKGDKKTEGDGEAKIQGKAGKGLDTMPLRTQPWIFLPPEIRGLVEGRLGSSAHANADSNRGGQTGWKWEDEVISVVVGKNSSIKSLVGRMGRLLKGEPGIGMGLGKGVGKGKDGDVGQEDKNKMLVVSAYGDAATKMVGIVEVVRRVFGTECERGDRGGGTGKGKKDMDKDVEKPEDTVTWYMYTILSSHEITLEPHTSQTGRETANQPNPKAQKQGDGDQDKAEESAEPMDVDVEEGHQQRHQHPTAPNHPTPHPRTRKIPVLMLWLCKSSIPEFKHAFGEGRIVVKVQRGAEKGEGSEVDEDGGGGEKGKGGVDR